MAQLSVDTGELTSVAGALQGVGGDLAAVLGALGSATSASTGLPGVDAAIDSGGADAGRWLRQASTDVTVMAQNTQLAARLYAAAEEANIAAAQAAHAYPGNVA